MGKIPTLRFLSRLQNLEEIIFWEDTNVVDGDVGLLLKLPKLKNAGFRNRRHYTYRVEEVNRLLQSKGSNHNFNFSH
jgi:hypothetical protein